jgi:cytochrome c-type biogenesis protein CcmE
VSLAHRKSRKYSDQAGFREASTPMRKRSQRLWLFGAAGVLAAGAIGLAAVALQDTISFFQSPSDIVAKGTPNTRQSVRVGGLVEVGSTGHNEGGDLVF